MFAARRFSAHRPSRVLAALVTATMVAPTIVGPGLAAAQEAKAGVVTALQGRAVVARPVIPQPLPLKFKDDLFVRDRVETREDSLVRILLGGKALVTVRELSNFTVTEEPNRAVLDLRSGKAAVSVAPSLLRPGESVEVRTPNAVAGIRGSLLVITVAQVGNDFQTMFEALQASKPITVAPLGATGPGVQLNANQSVGVTGTGAQAQIGPVVNMTPAQAQAAARTAEAPRPSEQTTSSPMAQGIAAASMAQATQLVAALQGAPSPDVLFQPATIAKAQGGGATENLANQISTTSQLQVDATQANVAVAENPSLTTASAPPAPAPPPPVTPPPVAQPVTPPPPVVVEPPPPVVVQPPPVVVVLPPVTPPPPVVVEPPPVTPPPPPVVVEPPPVTPPPPPVVVEPPPTEPLADVAIVNETRAVPSGATLRTFSGTTDRTATRPVVLIDHSTVTSDTTLVDSASGSQVTTAGPLMRVTSSEVHTDGSLVHLAGGTTAVTGSAPALSFNPSFVNAGRGVIRLDGGAGLSVQGPLVSSVNTEFLVGDTLNNTFGLLSLLDGASILQFGPSDVPLLVFDASQVSSAGPLVSVRRSPSESALTFLLLNGPLFQAVNGSTFTTMSLGFAATFGSPAICCPAFAVQQGSALVSNTAEPLIQLSGGSRIISGPSERSGSSFFAVTDTFPSAPAGERVSPSVVALQGPLLRLTGASEITALSHLLDITRSTLFGASAEPLIQLTGGSTVTLGGENPFTGAATTPRFLNLDGTSAQLVLQRGSLLDATDASITGHGTAQLFGILGGATLGQSLSEAPLISLTRTSVSIPDRGASFFEVRGALPGGSLPTEVELSGKLLWIDSSTIVSGGNLVRISAGGRLTTSLTGEPLVRFTGGSFTGGIPGQASGGSLLRMFSDRGTGDTLLSVGRYLESIGATLVSRDGASFNIGDGSVITSTGPGPFARFEGGSVTAEGANSFIALTNNSSFTAPGQPATFGNGHAPFVSIEGTMVELTATSQVVVDSGGTLISMTAPATAEAPAPAAPMMTLGGSLLAARNATISNGNPAANTNPVVFVGDGSTLETTGSAPLLSFDASTVDSAGNILTLRRSASANTPSTLTLGGPLFVATNGSNFNATSLGLGSACCGAVFVAQGANLVGPLSADALMQLRDSTFVARDSQSGSTFFSVNDRAPFANELVAPASVSLQSPLLSASHSTISALFSLVSVQRSAFTSTHADPLIQLDQTTVSLGGTDPFSTTNPTYAALLLVQGFRTDGSVAPPRFDGSVSLGGPVLRATGSQLSVTGDGVGVFDGGQFVGGSSTAALIELNGGQLSAGGNSLGDILQVDRAGGANQVTLPKATLRGPLLSATNGAALDITGGFVAAFNGGQVVVTGPGASQTLVSVDGGSHRVSTEGNRAMFDLAGRTASVVRDELGLVVTADQPLQHGGRLLDTSNARINEGTPSGRFVSLDRALLEASLPLMAATSNSLIRTASHGVDMSASRLTAVGDLIQLNASRFDVVSGALANVAGGSRLTVGGNLVTLANGSTLNLMNGPVLNVSGNSLVDITGAMIGFSGAGNTVNVTNELCTAGCSTIGGLRVRLNGTPANNVSVNSAITGAGTVNLSPNAAHVSVSGGSSRVIIGPR